MYSGKIQTLIESLCCLPGVGRKSAQRMALQILEHKKEPGLKLAQALQDAIAHVTHCKQCRNLTDQEYCHLCQQIDRDRSTLCVVESPSDVFAIEQSGAYRGLYFVLMGHLSPLDGVGPKELGLDYFLDVLPQECQEVVLATNPTVEGEATASFIAELLKGRVDKVSRIAHGVPMGGELEYIDGGTLAMALSARSSVAVD